MWKRFLLLLFVFGLSASCFGASVNWNASIVDAEHGAPDGYRVYYGLSSDGLGTVYDNGLGLQFAIPDEWPAGEYYFSVRAYNQSGESGWATTPEGQTWVSYVKADPPPVLPPAPATDVQIVWNPIEEPQMAIEQTGSTLGHLMASGTDNYAWSVTIPADTTCIIIAVGGYAFHTGEPLISANLNGTQNFTVDQSLDAANDSAAAIGHLFSPSSTGAQTINVTIGGHGYDVYIFLAFFRGTDTTGLRDSDEAQSNSLTLTTTSGDVVVAIATDQDNNSISWTNATEIGEYGFGGGYCSALAITTADGASETVTASGSNDAIAAIVLIPASGGGASAVPKIMLLQDHFSGGIH